jgi:transposase InsO family protein
MSKNRVIVLSITNQNLTVKQAATKYSTSERRIYQLLAKFRQGGLDAVEPASRKPKTNPNQTSPQTIEKILSLRHELANLGLDNGAQTIAWHLKQQGIKPPAISTIWRVLKNAGLVTPQPKKKPKAYLQRFEALQPNETWQSDFTHWRLADGTDIEILNWLDDHSRFLLSCTAHKPVNGVDVVEKFKACVNEYGTPQSTLTDNGSVYTARFVKGRNQFEHLLRTLNVIQKNGSPGHPQTQGKIERLHQTQKRWLARQKRAENIHELQLQLDKFSQIYNHERPHKALGLKTPAHAYNDTVKAAPEGTSLTTHYRVRFDTIDKFGKLTLRRPGQIHHLGIGIKFAGIPVMMLVDETDVTVTHLKTGEVISSHVIDDNHNYWPKQQGR